jgi:predicted lipoprotein with Yx(FWY)xxD motif
MKRSVIAMSGLAGLTLAATACGGYTSGHGVVTTPTTAVGVSVAGSPPTTVALASTDLGQILVDNQGRTLYLFEADANGKSACTSVGCVAEWPPLTTSGSPQAAAGLTAKGLGTTTRPDGAQQVTYDGHPLYHFAGDAQPGATSGQGLNDNGGLWYAVRTDGTAVTG